MTPEEVETGLLSAGTLLGDYELIRRLAIGGMAEIYLARKRGLQGFEKKVVLKRILPQHAVNREFVTMFLDEARLAARLHHANVAQVYDIGCTDGHYFFTMEHVHGEDARALVGFAARSREPIDVGHVLAIIRDAAAGLHNAHAESDHNGVSLGIVHRDVSLSNILVSFDGCVKVVDFGVAKASQHEGETRAGTLKGKVGYMSPEQVSGKVIDRRSDVFSLGVCMYELLCSRRLFSSANAVATAQKITTLEPPPLSDYRRDVHEAIEKVLQKALAKDPDDRFQSARELQVALEAAAAVARVSISNAGLADYMQDIFAEKLTLTRLMDRDFSVTSRERDGGLQLDSSAQGSGEVKGLAGDAALVEGALQRHAAGSEVGERVSRSAAGPRIVKALGLGALVCLALASAWILGASQSSGETPSVQNPAQASDRAMVVEPRSPVVASPAKAHAKVIDPTPSDRAIADTAGDTKDSTRVGRKKSRTSDKASRNSNHAQKKRRKSSRKIPDEKSASKSPAKEASGTWDPDSALPPM